jgi:hypothetical protein
MLISYWLVKKEGLNIEMAYQAWVTTSERWCDRIQADARKMERRIYPAEVLPDFSGYRVAAQKCSLGTTCNLAGFSCKWAYNEVGDDPFKPSV